MSSNAYFTLLGTRLLYKTRRNAYWRDSMTGKKVFIRETNGTLMYRDEGTDAWHPIEVIPQISSPVVPVKDSCGVR